MNQVCAYCGETVYPTVTGGHICSAKKNEYYPAAPEITIISELRDMNNKLQLIITHLQSILLNIK